MEGHAGHAAMPHLTRDPVLGVRPCAGGDAVRGVAQLWTRSTRPWCRSACLRAGGAANQIPHRAEMRGTFRTHRPAVHAQVEAAIRRVVDGDSRRRSTWRGAVEIHHGHCRRRPIQCGRGGRWPRGRGASRSGLPLRRDLPPSMASEDFGAYLLERPGAFVWIGNGPSDGGRELHNPGITTTTTRSCRRRLALSSLRCRQDGAWTPDATLRLTRVSTPGTAGQAGPAVAKCAGMSKASRRAGRDWLRRRNHGWADRAARPVVALGVLVTTAAWRSTQGACIAIVLGGALATQAAVAPAVGHRRLLRSPGCCARQPGRRMSERLATGRPHGQARQRLRLDVLGRLLAAGPAMLAAASTRRLWPPRSVDRIDALDGFFARWLPAADAWRSPAPLIVLAAVRLGRLARRTGVGRHAGLLVPVAQAVSGIGAAAASRNQFTALSAACRPASWTASAASPPSCSPGGRATKRARIRAGGGRAAAAHHAGAARGVHRVRRAWTARVALALVVLATAVRRRRRSQHRLHPAPALFVLLMPRPSSSRRCAPSPSPTRTARMRRRLADALAARCRRCAGRPTRRCGAHAYGCRRVA